jgi:hypothetical protein
VKKTDNFGIYVADKLRRIPEDRREDAEYAVMTALRVYF